MIGIPRKPDETLAELLARVTRDLQIARDRYDPTQCVFMSVRSDDVARLLEAAAAVR